MEPWEVQPICPKCDTISVDDVSCVWCGHVLSDAANDILCQEVLAKHNRMIAFALFLMAIGMSIAISALSFPANQRPIIFHLGLMQIILGAAVYSVSTLARDSLGKKRGLLLLPVIQKPLSPIPHIHPLDLTPFIN
ncbi:hypothetical protein MNBD_NITROSPINAE02-72 [hydrothermal vent metagenome]|uniref:Uncharacterized protein n=1 Tax=hydrothermal vent metagenome TaxID=652676 RepID=A0A3B1BV13_9ZZZZ